MKLTDYNATAKTLGYPAETLNKETDSLILPSKIYLRAASQEELKKMSSSLTLEHGNMNYNFSGNKILMDNIISPSNNFFCRCFGFNVRNNSKYTVRRSKGRSVYRLSFLN